MVKNGKPFGSSFYIALFIDNDVTNELFTDIFTLIGTSEYIPEKLHHLRINQNNSITDFSGIKKCPNLKILELTGVKIMANHLAQILPELPP